MNQPAEKITRTAEELDTELILALRDALKAEYLLTNTGSWGRGGYEQSVLNRWQKVLDILDERYQRKRGPKSG